MTRRVFYSFHYRQDNWRAAMVRNTGSIDGNSPASDNDWETVKKGGDAAIKRWIATQMTGRTCTVVLVGSNTANRKWINYEIVKSWNDGMGVVGIRVHGLKDQDGLTSLKGGNPFQFIPYGNTGDVLSSVVKCYDPAGYTSQERYAWISKYLGDAIEKAISIRTKY